jgi:hypothetical protein
MNEQIEKLEKEVASIKARNEKVEIDKAWEVSITRRVLIVAFTYIIIGTYLAAIGVDRPWINAIVPAVGFTLSTLTLPFFKKLWVNIKDKKRLPKNK